MAAQDYYGVVQQLYVSYFGRPADFFGLQNFANQLDAMKAPTDFKLVQAAAEADRAGTSPLAQLINSFNNSPESQALYGTDNSQLGTSKFVAAIYQNVLGRDADVAGFNFWVGEITAGRLTKANAAAAITQGALSNTSPQGLLDKVTVQNKVAVATAFTTALDTPAEWNAYAGEAAAATGRSLVQGVNNTTDLTAYQANIADAIVSIINVSTPGATQSLTVGVDNFAGTAGDDVFNAIPLNATGAGADTLGSFDIIDGGAGKDTLNIYTDATHNLDQQGTVKNVETINIYNQTGVFGGSAVDASKFVGATAVWQIGAEADIKNVGASTTAGFRAISAADLSVTGSAATVAVALDQIAGDDVNNVSKLAVGGTKLTGVTVTGNLVDNDTAVDAGAAGASLELTATIAKDAQTLTVNSAVKTTLKIVDTDSTKKVTTVAAGSSTGAITFVGDADVTTITTGNGADKVTLATTLNATVKAATLNTGDGKDTIVISATGTDVAVDSVTVNAGAGDDKITVTLDSKIKYNVTGGAGDDIIQLNGTVKTGDTIDGGEGKDTIGLAGKAGYVADDYLVYTKVLKGFEAIEFTGAVAATGFDASQVASFKEFVFDAGGAITKVAADQAVTTAGDLTVTSAGYTAAGAAAATSTTVYSTDTATGALKVTVTDDAAVTASGNSIALAVNALSGEAAGAAGNVAASLTGDVKTATIALTNGVDADDAFSIASVTVATVKDADSLGANTELGALTSLTLTGNGTADVNNGVGTKLVTVDASGLASVDAAGAATAGLTYTSANASAETIKLGASIDNVTLSASAFGGVGSHTWDTVTGLNLVLDEAGTALAASSDILTITGATKAVKFTTTETDIDLALKAAAAANNADAAHDTLVFAFGGDTYVFIDSGANAGLIDATDTVVKLTGTVNLDTLAIALTA